MKIGRKILKWFVILVFIYMLGWGLLYILQDRLLFDPVKVPKDEDYGFASRHTEVNIPINESTNLNIIQFLTDSPSRGVVLYFHGNGQNVKRYARHAELFTIHGYEVWMIDYPGFGKSTGEFTEQKVYDWAILMYDMAANKFVKDSIVIYGKSFGTGVAAYVASRKSTRHLILETPYYDFPSLVRNYLPIYPVNKILKYEMPTHRYLERVIAPVLIFHGTRDRVIPLKNASRLKPMLKPGDEFLVVEDGSHNNTLNFDEVRNRIAEILRGDGTPRVSD